VKQGFRGQLGMEVAAKSLDDVHRVETFAPIAMTRSQTKGALLGVSLEFATGNAYQSAGFLLT
jgi:hypothetical protein